MEKIFDDGQPNGESHTSTRVKQKIGFVYLDVDLSLDGEQLRIKYLL